MGLRNRSFLISVLLYVAFNAGLVIAGIMLASQATAVSIPGAPSRTACREGLESAARALTDMNGGSKTIERCQHYLQHLLRAIETLGKPLLQKKCSKLDNDSD